MNVEATAEVRRAARALVTGAHACGAHVGTRVRDAAPGASAGAPCGAHRIADTQQTAGVIA